MSAYDKGIQVCRAGALLSDCPYHVGTWDWEWWRAGWYWAYDNYE